MRFVDQLRGKMPLRSAFFTAFGERMQSSGPAQILDVGCGSGVLAIAALRLWPRATAVAIDTDPEAVEVTLENAERNQVTSRLLCETTLLNKLRAEFALITANLTGPTLIELCEQLAARACPGGVLILSGILEVEVDKVAERFLAQGLVETARATEDEWAALQYVRPAQ
jgi:ribosomal protein L11 methyltransferase